MPPNSPHELLEALDDVVDSLEEACAESERAADQVRALRQQAKDGDALPDLLARSEPVPVVRRVATVLSDLGQASSRLRRAQAQMLHDEGFTTDRIAELFGVTRQRISAILHNGR